MIRIIIINNIVSYYFPDTTDLDMVKLEITTGVFQTYFFGSNQKVKEKNLEYKEHFYFRYNKKKLFLFWFI
jgi:hypothetical protein